MVLNEWQLWHTYSTFFTVEVQDLEAAGRALVESGIAVCALHRDGKTFWESNNLICEGRTSIRMSSNSDKASISLAPNDAKMSLNAFAKASWLQACSLRFNEIRQFGDDENLPPEAYTRAFLGRCDLDLGEEGLFYIYPNLKLYASGVVLIEFQMLSPETGCKTEDFIKDYLDLPRKAIKQISVPPAIARLAPTAYLYSKRISSLRARVALLILEKSHLKAVNQKTSSCEEGEFNFELAPLTNEEEADYDTLSNLALTIVGVVGFALVKHRKPLDFLLRGPDKFPQMGPFWVGRPHIYLLQYENQRETAEENERCYRNDFRQIMSKNWRTDFTRVVDDLPNNSRAFDDYTSYIGIASTLWVCAKKGLDSYENDAGMGRKTFVYANQSIVEMLEYGYMLHRGLYERVVGHSTPEAVLRARRDLVSLRQVMSGASHFTELRELLQAGWERFGVPSLQERTNEALEIKASETALIEARRVDRRGRLLSLVAGLVAVPPIANEVVGPIWTYFRWWQPTGAAFAKLFIDVVAVAFVGIFIQILFWSYKRSTPHI